MSLRRMLEWALMVATALVLIFLKWLHLGVLHYNWFMIILLGWTLGLVLVFRFFALTFGEEKGS